MNKRTFRFVLLLMAISAVSAIFFQINWLKDSQQLTNKIFEENARLAITTTANIISEDQQNENIMIDGHVDAGWHYNSKDSLYSFNFYSVSKYKDSPPYTKDFYNQLEALNQSFTEHITQDTTVMKRVTVIYSQHNNAISSVYERINIDSILKSNLQKNNINLKFSYGFYHTHDSTFYNIGGEKVKDTLVLRDAKFKVKVEQVPTMHVQLYDSSSYVYKKLLANIIGSTLLVLIVISSFAYALRIIMKQKKLSQIKTDFINNMTHELKTPLATIGMATATIEEPDIIKNPEVVKQFTKVIKEENERMNRQIEMVLNVAKEDETIAKLNKKVVDINDILEPIIEHNRIRVKRNKGGITYKPNAVNTTIECDEIHIYQAINNLVDNAIKYSKDPIEITISSKNKDGFLIINVTDKGIGIKKQDESLIFDKFYRVPTKDVHNVKGFGLGLNYVKRIATAHNGAVHFKRNAIGSTFSIQLPLKKA
ncbi:HAMP domain-containing sensor histidine kinase [Aureibaculum sp. 2210JD6-5]|uniref:sensor histidine kinase n=1 Tax=Aureibaculum sp. 2210JD6-5 TaxID=3103957 RepID=UPI002AAE080D|nr:HAMP domain-containing sensor histidine kinase [Aureibaculum sp. 2210JD6-5]MDY7394071.1 HAMP domain-containing sensor histidine kinase [Aureibaculum sp. 2210JD6-5]